MSVVTLQLGQCGNQLGLSFFDKLAHELEHFSAEDRECFFRSHDAKTIASHESNGAATARAVLIDMEPKVILLLVGGLPWQYDDANVVCEQSGSGSFVCDSLRELYPTSYLLNTVVWPYRSGEVIVQNYNTLLTMACLSESSDGVLIVENDLADQICRRLLAIPTPSFHQMNQVLTNHIAAMLMPALPFQVLLYLCVCTYASYVSNWRSNSQAILPQVESMLDKAHRMFTSNAYVHQYATHGVDADFFQSCFLRLDQMVVNYKSL
ncbi:hypothetical protein DYB38_007584 [Aphanomyces astaci]|uniref:Tubulin delta chain n=1 Tax=Aphanomyces astaci TaxID=112090 RepID=A0A397DRM8_APHAT|nr:hypothetical protein DYB38_007584 [Aphanomyces astaci]